MHIAYSCSKKNHRLKVTPETLKTLTNKTVYAEMTSTFPPPKVVMESDRDYGTAWMRLYSPVVDDKAA